MDVQVEYLATLSPLLEPIDEIMVCGDDPRYDERFLKIKAEVEKSKYIDYHLIKQLAIDLLTYQCKDLRVAGYLILACGQTDGIMGAVTAIHVYAHLVQTFWEQLHPRRAIAQQAAFDWLQSQKLTQLMGSLTATSQQEQAAQQRAIAHLKQAVAPHQPSLATHVEHWLTPRYDFNAASTSARSAKQANYATPWTTTTKHTEAPKAPHADPVATDEMASPTQLAKLARDLQTRPAERDRFLQACQVVAQCLDEKAFDMAQPILENLTQIIERHQLAHWEPALALEAWVLQWQLYTASEKWVSERKLYELKKKIADISISALF